MDTVEVKLKTGEVKEFIFVSIVFIDGVTVKIWHGLNTPAQYFLSEIEYLTCH